MSDISRQLKVLDNNIECIVSSCTVTEKKLPSRPIVFDWDLGNQLKNWQKHEVDYTECEEVFLVNNKNIITFFDEKHSISEQRWLALGITEKNRKLSIFFTIRNKKIRVISARDMSKKEKKLYEK